MSDKLKIARMKVSKYRRIELFEMSPDGRSVILRSKNTRGKTTIIDSFFDAFKGFSKREVPRPIHDNEKKATIEIELTNKFVIRKSHTPSGPTLTVHAADGTKFKDGHELMQSLYAEHALDPGKFTFAKESKQKEMILEVVKVPVPVEQVKAITGEDIPAKEEETAEQYVMRLCADNTGVFYLRRRDQNTKTTTINGALVKQRKLVEDLEKEASASGYDDDQDEIRRKLAEAREVAASKQTKKAAYDEVKKRFDEPRGQMTKLESSIELKNASIKTCEDKIAELKAELARQEEHLKVMKDHLHAYSVSKVKGDKLLSALQGELDMALEDYNAIPDVSKDIESLEGQLTSISNRAKADIKLKAAIDQQTDLSSQYEESVAKHAALDVMVEGLRALKTTLLEDIKVLPGLSIKDDLIFYNGNPFEQASGREKVEVAVKLAMLANPQIALLTIDNGEMFDTESRDYLFQVAMEHGWQVIMACVSDDDEIAVSFIEGDADEPEADDQSEQVNPG